MTLIDRILNKAQLWTAPIFPDKTYLKMRWSLIMKRPLDLDHPRTMNEKLQWLKLNNRYPLLTDLVDKIKVKEVLAPKIGEEHIIPTLKVWRSADEITAEDIAALPDKFVIKTNHSGGNNGVVICRDKTKLDLEDVRRKMKESMRSSLYLKQREWPYKNVERRIFAETYLADDIVDYKFYCFNGEVDCVLMCLDRQSEGKTRFYFFDKDWNLLRYNKAGREAPEGFTLPRPKNLEKMFELAGELSKGFPFVRVDLYNIDGKIYFGELTFYPDAGMDPNRLPEYDIYFGDKIDLSLARNEEK